MSDQRKKTAVGGVSVHEVAAQATLGKDPRSSKLLNAGAALGNEEMQRRIAKGNASRDQMLAYLCDRLKVMREAQKRELEKCLPRERRESWRLEADAQKTEFGKPAPTRWGEPARVYEEAAYQLCRGALSRGAQLVERATELERKVFEQTTKTIDLEDLEKEAEAPGCVGDAIGSTQACAPCDLPGALEIADEIQRVSTEAEDMPNRRRTRDPYWTEFEEEEEEEEGNA